MLNRRAFIETAVLAIPLAGCARTGTPAEETPIGNLTPQQMAAVRQNAGQFESTLEIVRKADIPYAMEPRFYPTV